MSSKFRGFLDGGSARPPATSSGGGSVARHDPDRSEAYAEIARAARAEGRTVGLNSAKPCFAIALDATGSMSDLIDNARRSIGKILNGIYAEAKTQVRIKMYVYRDYDVPRGLCESSDLTSDSQALSRWLSSVRAYGGGSNAGEAIEVALEAIYASNSRDTLNAFSHPQQATAREWAPRFSQMGIPIHTFLVGDRADTKADFEAIAKLSGGQSGTLDGSDAMTHMAVLAMLERLGGTAAVERYAGANLLPAGARDFSLKLISGRR
jgi:hypothetical protein